MLARAYAAEPAARFEDVLEFVLALEQGMASGGPPPPRHQPLYERNPLLVWKLVSAVLALLLALSLARH